MKFMSSMIVVSDMARSKKFYGDLFGETVLMDLGANVTLSGGLALQEKNYWATLMGKPVEEIRPGNDNFELYYETDDLDAFLPRLEASGAQMAQPVGEAPWGQRTARFYDPDHNLIEVGENMEIVIKRFFAQGMTPEQVSQRTGIPLEALMQKP